MLKRKATSGAVDRGKSHRTRTTRARGGATVCNQGRWLVLPVFDGTDPNSWVMLNSTLHYTSIPI